jgi:hypothetical protein
MQSRDVHLSHHTGKWGRNSCWLVGITTVMRSYLSGCCSLVFARKFSANDSLLFPIRSMLFLGIRGDVYKLNTALYDTVR